MMQRLSCLFYGFLKIAANAQRLGLGMIRVAILIIFVWIGGQMCIRDRPLCVCLFVQ